MSKHQEKSEQKYENEALILGMLTEYAFYQSFKQSKTLQIMTAIGLIFSAGFVYFLLYMADKM